MKQSVRILWNVFFFGVIAVLLIFICVFPNNKEYTKLFLVSQRNESSD